MKTFFRIGFLFLLAISNVEATPITFTLFEGGDDSEAEFYPEDTLYEEEVFDLEEYYDEMLEEFEVIMDYDDGDGVLALERNGLKITSMTLFNQAGNSKTLTFSSQNSVPVVPGSFYAQTSDFDWSADTNGIVLNAFQDPGYRYPDPDVGQRDSFRVGLKTPGFVGFNPTRLVLTGEWNFQLQFTGNESFRIRPASGTAPGTVPEPSGFAIFSILIGFGMRSFAFSRKRKEI